MEYYSGDNLNSLIRWAVYAYGYEFDDCLNTNYTQLTQRLSETNWEVSAYPRRNDIYTQMHSTPILNIQTLFSACLCLPAMHTNRSF